MISFKSLVLKYARQLLGYVANDLMKHPYSHHYMNQDSYDDYTPLNDYYL